MTTRNSDAIVSYGDGGFNGVGVVRQGQGGSGSSALGYKRVRDMDYVKPPVIMRVKESGELYVPNPDQVCEQQNEGCIG